MDEAQKASPGITAPITGAFTLGCDRPPSVDRLEGMITDNSNEIISWAAASSLVDPVAVKGVISLLVPEEGAIAPAGSNFLPPVTFPPVLEAEPDGSRPRSPLRDGTLLDGLVASRDLVGSLFARDVLIKVAPPAEESKEHNCCRRFEDRLLKAARAVKRTQPDKLVSVARDAIARFHTPMYRDIANSKTLPKHLAIDPIDPTVVFVRAITLGHRVLHDQTMCASGCDFDGVAYLTERLGEAVKLRTVENDIRFNLLQALAAFFAAILEKADGEGTKVLQVA